MNFDCLYPNGHINGSDPAITDMIQNLDSGNRSRNDPCVLIPPRKILAFYNAHHWNQKEAKMNQKIMSWFIEIVQKADSNWTKIETHGSQCLLSINPDETKITFKGFELTLNSRSKIVKIMNPLRTGDRKQIEVDKDCNIFDFVKTDFEDKTALWEKCTNAGIGKL